MQWVSHIHFMHWMCNWIFPLKQQLPVHLSKRILFHSRQQCSLPDLFVSTAKLCFMQLHKQQPVSLSLLHHRLLHLGMDLCYQLFFSLHPNRTILSFPKLHRIGRVLHMLSHQVHPMCWKLRLGQQLQLHPQPGGAEQYSSCPCRGACAVPLPYCHNYDNW